jgi:hypothetical protein
MTRAEPKTMIRGFDGWGDEAGKFPVMPINLSLNL